MIENSKNILDMFQKPKRLLVFAIQRDKIMGDKLMYILNYTQNQSFCNIQLVPKILRQGIRKRYFKSKTLGS